MTEVFGARVRQARLLRRMTATSVVESVGWTNHRQTKIEKSPTIWLDDADVERLAALFRFPARVFSSEPQSRV
ncbi:MAG: helix-turn-helix domain-containing protein, partial [Dechloromonas sp.]|nr:helix-turn-helix domain-containing protein [Dechloromonas sp.]